MTITRPSGEHRIADMGLSIEDGPRVFGCACSKAKRGVPCLFCTVYLAAQARGVAADAADTAVVASRAASIVCDICPRSLFRPQVRAATYEQIAYGRGNIPFRGQTARPALRSLQSASQPGADRARQRHQLAQ